MSRTRRERVGADRPGTHLRAQVAQACRILAMEGHNDLTLGHVSARNPEAQTFWVKGAGVGLDEVRTQDVTLADLDGRKRTGRLPLHGEIVIHTAIYRARPDVHCVIHTHPFYTTCLGALDRPLQLLLQDSVTLVDGVSVFADTPELLVTDDHGAALAACLGRGRVVLLRNHGVVVVGESIPQAVLLAIALERTARAQLLTAAGRIPHSIDPATARRMAGHFARLPHRTDGLWAYLLRRLERQEHGGAW